MGNPKRPRNPILLMEIPSIKRFVDGPAHSLGPITQLAQQFVQACLARRRNRPSQSGCSYSLLFLLFTSLVLLLFWKIYMFPKLWTVGLYFSHLSEESFPSWLKIQIGKGHSRAYWLLGRWERRKGWGRMKFPPSLPQTSPSTTRSPSNAFLVLPFSPQTLPPLQLPLL